MKSLKKWLQASRRRQAGMEMSRRMHKEQRNEVPSKIGISRTSRRKQRWKRMTGKMKTSWKCSGDEDHKLEEILGRRRMEGSTLQVEARAKCTRISGT